MDEIKRLEEEIDTLQRSIKERSAELSKRKKQLTGEEKKRLDSCRQDMQRAVREHDGKRQAEYEELLRRHQKNLDESIRSHLQETDGEYRRLQGELRAAEEALLEKSRELKEMITLIRENGHRQADTGAGDARAYLQSAVNLFRRVEQKAHRKFMPGRLQVFFRAIKDGQKLYRAGFFEAASAVAVSARSGLERLSYIIDEKTAEWEDQYELFGMKLSYLQEKVRQDLEDFESLISESSQGDALKKKLHLIEINFWSKGDFAALVRGVKNHQSLLRRVEELGAETYLKQPDSLGTEELKERIAEVEHLDRLLADLAPLYKQRHEAACRRADWGEAIIDFLTGEVDLLWQEAMTGYEEAEVEEQKRKEFSDYTGEYLQMEGLREDMRRQLRLVFENSSKTRIYVYILPIEEGAEVTNRILVYIDYPGAEQEQYSKDILGHIREALAGEEDCRITQVRDMQELSVSENSLYRETGRDLERIVKQRGG